MPIFEYRCKECGGTIETLEISAGFVNEVLQWCGCENDQVETEEVISAPAIRFKGAGFHINDYGRGPRYTVSSAAKKRYRQEIRDAQNRKEV